MLVSFCVVAYNEEEYLPSLLEDILNQTYNHKLIEVVLVDGISKDKTFNIMNKFATKYSEEFNDIKVIKNLKRKQASGWNLAIKNAKGDIITRIDAHSHVPSDFIEKNVSLIKSGENVTGGPRPNIIDDETNWKKTLLLAETSMFGSGFAVYRRDTKEKKYVNSMFHGTYRKEIFEKVGGFNEFLGRTEDNELHYRIRKAGYKLCFDSSIVSYQHIRNSLRKMMKQKYLNGFWVALTLGVAPKCLSLFHFVPLVFVLSIVCTSILCILGIPQLAMIMWSLYWTLAIIMMIITMINNEFNMYLLLLPILFFLLHVSYGIGSVVGLVKMPFFAYGLKNNMM